MLVPFWVMRWVHHRIGYTDAFQVADTEWDRVSAQYNLAMVFVLLVGLGTFIGYADRAFQRDRSRVWLFGKLLIATAYGVIAFVR